MVQSVRESLVGSQSSVLNHREARHLEIAAIESTFIVHEFHPRKQKWVKRARTAFNVIVQDMDDSRSLVRYISDVVDFDRRIRAYDRKCKIPSPNLVEPHHLVPDVSSTRQRHHRRRQRLSLLLKKTIAGFRCQKSNSEKFEIYLRRCVLHPIIGRSSLLRDFLSAQRSEDRIMPLRAIEEHICLDQQQPASIAAPPICFLSRSSSSSSTSCPTETEDTSVSSSPPVLLFKEPGRGQLCPSMAEEESRMIMDDKDEKEKKKLTIQDFELIKVLGGGCTGKVLLVRPHRTSKLLALKAIPKPQVFLRSQIGHAKTERKILSVLSQRRHPFLVQLQYAFQDPNFLFLAFDFYAGGDLATQLKLHTRFRPSRCRLYAAEILLGIEELHRWGILYRDLKPENILIGADGHLVLTDFGLSKWTEDDGTRRANTICGTPEYLAPEVVCGYDYGYEVDYWSYGTILYEMIDGFPPFWDEDSDVMFRQIVAAPLEFGSHRFDLAARDLLSGLLERDPARRLGREKAAIRAHRFFMSLDWAGVYHKQYTPEYVPRLEHPEDVSHFDQEFLDMPVECALENDDDAMDGRSQMTMSDFDGYSFVNVPSPRYPPSFVNDLKTLPGLRETNLTDPPPAPFLLGQQANHGRASHYWYHTEDVVHYDWIPESDLPDISDDEHPSSVLDWPAPPPRPAAPVGLSRHYGARQINPAAVTATV